MGDLLIYAHDYIENQYYGNFCKVGRIKVGRVGGVGNCEFMHAEGGK